MSLKPIAPRELKRRLDDGSAVLVDIREADEYAREHIAGARLAPLSGIEQYEIDCEPGKAVAFTCRSGNRTTANSGRIAAKGFGDAYVLTGGLDAWKAAGLPVQLNRSAPIDLQRQVQIGAGSLVLAGVVLGFTISPWFFLLSGAVGAGLLQAGITGFCGMARLLGVMPWNKPQPA